MESDCASVSSVHEPEVLEEQSVSPSLPMGNQEPVNNTLGHLIPIYDVTQRTHQHIRPTVRNTYEVKAGLLVNETLFTYRDLSFIVEIERIFTKMAEFMGMSVLNEVLELEVISSQYKFLEFYGLLNEFSTMCDILHKNSFHLERTNFRCCCVILSVHSLAHLSELKDVNPVQVIVSRPVRRHQKDVELQARLYRSALEPASVIGDTSNPGTSYLSLQPIPRGFSHHRQTQSSQAVTNSRRFLVPSPIEVTKISTYKPTVDLKGTPTSPIFKGQGESNKASPTPVKGIIRTPGAYTPTKSVSFMFPEENQPLENIQGPISPDATKVNHPGVEAISLLLVKRKHSDVAKDPSRPFCDIDMGLKRRKDTRSRTFTKRKPRKPISPCPPPPPNTPTGLGSPLNIDALTMELHKALTKIRVSPRYYPRRPSMPLNSSPKCPKPFIESPFVSIGDSFPTQPVPMYPLAATSSGRKITSIQEVPRSGLES
ncbi:hypothetical protein DFP73DRAFT_524824 [Morchella snyderi]|nr:hypothetical protein DFP73DRAFT_524824 [Morchella snyderi]